MKSKSAKKLNDELFTKVRKIETEGRDEATMAAIQELIDQGADMTDSGNAVLTSPLMIAIKSGMYEVVELFIRNAADVNSASFGMYNGRGFSKTPLYLAAEIGSVEMVKLLVSAGALLEKSEKSIISPIQIAAENNHQNVVDFFGTKGVFLDPSNPETADEVNTAGDLDSATAGN